MRVEDTPVIAGSAYDEKVQMPALGSGVWILGFGEFMN